MRSGFVGEPAMRIPVDDPKSNSEWVVRDQIQLNQIQTSQLYTLIVENIQTLKQMLSRKRKRSEEYSQKYMKLSLSLEDKHQKVKMLLEQLNELWGLVTIPSNLSH
jgi:hypothetical protein